MDDDLILVVGGRRLSGWTQIRVTRGIERVPSDFDIEMTENYPGELDVVTVKKGDPCEVRLDGDLVITGYVDRVIPTIDRGQHSIRVIGRSKCSDLVDCAAEWPGGQVNGTALAIAQKLVEPYGNAGMEISVRTDVDDLGPVIPQFNLILGESPMEIIERTCRCAALLAYDEPDGNLLLTRVGTVQAASGFQLVRDGQGDTSANNIQSVSIINSMDQSYSEVLAYIQSLDTLEDVGTGGNLLATETDPNVTRHRRRIIVAEYGDSNFDVTKRRAKWEVARRFGRSCVVQLTTDSWRDSDTLLWAPNTLVQLRIPALKLLDDPIWLISEVSYKRDGSNGTTADVTIMAPEAFIPQPVVLNPTFAEINQVSPQ
jgi:prophage tail gpP-like protein